MLIAQPLCWWGWHVFGSCNVTELTIAGRRQPPGYIDTDMLPERKFFNRRAVVN